MSREEQQQELASGRRRVHNSTLQCSGFRQLRASNSTIRGDNNHVVGDYNILIGKNNTADGCGNEFVVPVDPPPPPPVSVPARPPAELYRANDNAGSLFVEIMRAMDSAQDRLAFAHLFERPPLQSAAAARPRVPAAAAPPPPPVSESEVESAFDLPGEAVPGDSDETRCIVCLENQKDTLFKPCRHICCCRECARELARVHLQHKNNTAFSCPKCRKPVTALTIVFI